MRNKIFFLSKKRLTFLKKKRNKIICKLSLCFLIISMILVGGCSTKYPLIKGSDLVSPVSLTPVVSTNGKVENNRISTFEAEAGYDYSYWGLWDTKAREDYSYSNIQNNIIKATKGTARFSVNNLEFEIENDALNVYLLLGYYGSKDFNADVNGYIIEVK